MEQKITPILTPRAALEFLEKAVETKGTDFVYQKHAHTGATCRYSYQGEPDCLIGVALHLAGWTVEMLGILDRTSGGMPAAKTLHQKQVARGLLDSSACSVFNAAQLVQDEQKTWGVALEAARARVEVMEAAGYKP